MIPKGYPRVVYGFTSVCKGSEERHLWQIFGLTLIDISGILDKLVIYRVSDLRRRFVLLPLVSIAKLQRALCTRVVNYVSIYFYVTPC